jgi:hypothetical protein
MKIDSIRYKAFATNSSSVHTPIIVTDGAPEDFLVDECEFFGEPFVAASEQARRKYIGTALSCHLPINDFELRKAIVQQWVGVTIKDGGIDHQSLPVIPCRFGTTTPHYEYFKQLLKWFIQKGLVIVGGHDDVDEEEHDLTWQTISKIKADHKGNIIKYPYPKDDASDGRIVCRFDAKGFYTLFDRMWGTKIRLSFDDTVDMDKSTYPELVDLKITDKCGRGCSYCYQASTPDGKHAPYDEIRSLIGSLAKMEVFEIALGGGEPTLHPHFLRILTYAGERGIMPSFSTRNLSWLNSESAEIFKKFCGAFAYSIDSASEIEALEKVFEGYKLGGACAKNSVTLQFVLRPTTTQKDLDAIFEKNQNHNFPIILLGWKPMGRAATPAVSSPSTVGLSGDSRCSIDWIKTLSHYRISIDTAVASLYKEEIAKSGAADWSYKIVEGAHSMYIDAVARKMAKSSYCPESQYVSYEVFCDEDEDEPLAGEIAEAFKTF